MSYYYIYKNLFVESDLELDSSKYPIGNNVDDYMNGMYVPLNEQQIEYEMSHPNASQLEVWYMQELDTNLQVLELRERVYTDFENNHNFIYVNGQKHYFYDHREIAYNADCAKVSGENEITFIGDSGYFKGNVDNIIQICKLIGYYYYKANMLLSKHLTYLKDHPEEEFTYDYTTGYPLIPDFTIEEVNDIN